MGNNTNKDYGWIMDANAVKYIRKATFAELAEGVRLRWVQRDGVGYFTDPQTGKLAYVVDEPQKAYNRAATYVENFHKIRNPDEF